jgi:SAM-dependent methyltransferase
MSPPAQPKGVLNANYSGNREKKKELFFRYRVRATAVVETWRKHGASQDELMLLDLGAADGKTLAFMASSLPVKEAIGVEYNQELIQGDVTDLNELDDNSFDLISALALLEHISDPTKVIAEAARLLKPGGLFVSTSPVPFWDHVAVKLGLLKEDHHECDMHAEKFKGFIKETPALELIEFSPFMFAPVGILPYLGLQPSPSTSLRIDRFIHRMWIFNPLFVNQLAVARKTP